MVAGQVRGCGCGTNGELDFPELAEGVTYVAVGAGGSHTVLLCSDGTMKACGWHNYGQYAAFEDCSQTDVNM